MIDAWGSNMNNAFAPGYMNCLDESMSMWTNKFTCPGFMFVPCKPWPFGNEYHMVCCCLSGIMWGIDLVEGKDHPRQLGQHEYGELGSTVGLLVRMLFPIFHLGFVVILDSGFCVLKEIVELHKKGVSPVPSSRRGGTGRSTFMVMRSRNTSITKKLEMPTPGVASWRMFLFMSSP